MICDSARECAVTAWRASLPRRAAAQPPVLLLLPAYDLHAHDWIGAGEQREMAAAALRSGLFHLGTSPVAAEGALPVGLLDPGPRPPAEASVARER